MERITGYIDHIIFRNEENGYTVFQFNNEDGELTCVGKFPYIGDGEFLELEGEYVMHPSYGLQLQVINHKIKEPEDKEAIERYLGSGAIKGIGPALAGKIVAKFGEETFRIMEEEPERLSEIKGISEKKAREICVQVEEKKDLRQAMIYLQKYGISLQLAVKIYQKYGLGIYSVLEENPYRLADDIEGIGFKTADEIASRIGIHTDSDFRIQSGIYYTLLQSVQDGNVFLEEKVLSAKAAHLLEVEISDVEKYLMDLAMEKKVVLKRDGENVRVYPSRYYYMEMNTARMLNDLNIRYDESEQQIRKKIEKLEKKCELELDERQKEAVVEAVKNGIFILTGGPGTGKTTTINAMIRYFLSEAMDIRLAAPTGRAAKRMTETTGYEAQTIHRLLEVTGNPEEADKGGFGRNSDNPLETDVVIIDEMSMVDLPLMHALLAAIPAGTRLILVGDINQLPSVGPGKVLKDMIDSRVFPVMMLTRIFRQAQESDIVVNAHRIHAGEEIRLDNKSQDFFFLKRQDADVIISVILTLIQKKLPRYVDAKMTDIQVLAPMKKGLLGVERLNQILQKYLNPPSVKKQEKEYGEKIFRVGDKVMQTKNNYQLEWEISTKYGLVVDKGVGIFNGDIGIVTAIHTYDETVEVEFDEKRKVKYPFKLLEELELAYAITIHKSQGSEYPAVIIPLLSGPRQLYCRNLLYTAVTRAKKCVTLVGSETVFQEMVQNVDEQKRNTSLSERIRELLKGKEIQNHTKLE